MQMSLISCQFAGLVEYDLETNVIPHAARSWEVLDSGLRYLFHLRDDVRWTDGSQVTADDFTWAWKRNLAPGSLDYPASMLDDVLGARSYRLGENPDPDSVGVRALDPFTFEVHLESPVAYFIYLMAHPVSYPLPARVVQLYGEKWWQPPHCISNGAFQLVEISSSSYKFTRNPYYFGDFPGNLDGFDLELFQFGDPSIFPRFLEKKLDLCTTVNLDFSPVPVPPELQVLPLEMNTAALVFNPTLSPVHDVRVRRALTHGLDYQRIDDILYQGREAHHKGGLVPMGMAGFSPELGLPFDLPLAKSLLAEAGFPDGKGFPTLKIGFYVRNSGVDEFLRQLEANLGIHSEYVQIPFPTEVADLQNLHLSIMIWSPDYPDPDNILRQSHAVRFLKAFGWQHLHFDKLVAEAQVSTDRLHRLQLYREADRLLVDEQVVLIPLSHNATVGPFLIHPWVSGDEQNALGLVLVKRFTKGEVSSG